MYFPHERHPLAAALRPPRAGSADEDRRALRTALQGVVERYCDDGSSLRRAGYASPEDFTFELGELLGASGSELTAGLMRALFGGARDGGQLGRLLGVPA